jgi:fibronectin-binding autotransporter adhesin
MLAITPNLNNSQLRYALLGFTNPGTGNYATDSYGSTGWQMARFTVPETGTYILGFASFNLGDTALSPMLFIDEIQGTTTLNGQTFAPVAPNAGSTAPPAEPPPPPPPPPQFCCGGSNAAFTPNPVPILPKLHTLLIVLVKTAKFI